MPPLERILLIGFAQLRRYGHTRVSWFNKLHRGLIQNGHDVLFFSDRDVAAFEAPFGLRDLGKKKANRRLLETAESFAPSLILIGHADLITNATLAKLKARHPVPLVHLNNDPLFIPSNVDRIRRPVGALRPGLRVDGQADARHVLSGTDGADLSHAQPGGPRDRAF